MKKKVICILVCTFLIVVTVLPVVGSTCKNTYNRVSDEISVDNAESTDSVEYYKTVADNGCTTYIPGDYLINTEWGQWDLYNSLCPENHSITGNPRCRLGCWSIAIGQIINYHQLQSEGYVDYTCSYYNIVPQHIENDLDDHDYVWSKMVPKLNGSCTSDEIENVSRLLFDVATVIQKDFGSFHYKTIGSPFNVSPMINEIDDHFDYISMQTEWDDSLTESEIISEIDDNRPLMFYIKNDHPKDWHAVALDGYRSNGGFFEVHLNYGWNNSSGYNDWYNYYGPLPEYNNVTFRRAMLIRLAPKPPEISGPDTGAPGIDYNYTAKTIYEINPPLYYKFDWGDGTYTDWLGRYNSGESCMASHMWKEKGVYDVKVKVKDVDGWESEWSDPLEVSMPRNKPFNFNFNLFSWLFERFPHAFPIIRHLLDL